MNDLDRPIDDLSPTETEFTVPGISGAINAIHGIRAGTPCPKETLNFKSLQPLDMMKSLILLSVLATRMH
jgi:hypothetical protein